MHESNRFRDDALPAGMRATQATQAFLALWRSHPGACWSESDVEHALLDAGVRVNRVTVYRLLDRFERAGWLLRRVDADRVTRYVIQSLDGEYNADVLDSDPAHEASLECTGCHMPLAVAQGRAAIDSAMRALRAALATHGPAQQWEVALRGHCQRCAAEAAGR